MVWISSSGGQALLMILGRQTQKVERRAFLFLTVVPAEAGTQKRRERSYCRAAGGAGKKD